MFWVKPVTSQAMAFAACWCLSLTGLTFGWLEQVFMMALFRAQARPLCKQLCYPILSCCHNVMMSLTVSR